MAAQPVGPGVANPAMDAATPTRSTCPICKDPNNFSIVTECDHMFCEECVSSMETHEIAWKCGFCNTVGDYVIGFVLNDN